MYLILFSKLIENLHSHYNRRQIEMLYGNVIKLPS